MLLIASLLALASAQRNRYLLDNDFKFSLIGGPNPSPCANPNDFNDTSYMNKQCMGLNAAAYANDEASCLAACCADVTCTVYQWCPPGNPNCQPSPSCWIGNPTSCNAAVNNSWSSKGRRALPPPPPGPGPGGCTDPGCQPGTDDSKWRVLNLPHDFVVEGQFSQTAVESHGYLPLGKAWYRRHLTIPASAQGTVMYLDFDGAQSSIYVYLNGYFVGSHNSGYTPSRFFLNESAVLFGQENVLAVLCDGTQPDGWWC